MTAILPEGQISSAPHWLTPRRIRAHALILAICLWGVCAVDNATPGLFDRAGNIKFQDFLQFPISARLIAQHRADQLYDDATLAAGIRELVGRDTNVYLRYLYGPQVALVFLPLSNLSFLLQAAIWVAISLLIYFSCIYRIWRVCPQLRSCRQLVFPCALAFPPLFHFFVRGQLSAVALLCFAAAFLGFHSRREWLAGVALGCLFFKPQFLVAIPFILLFARAWKAFAGMILSAAAQCAFSLLYFGHEVMRRYFQMLLHSASQPAATELSLSPIQMHSLRSFWTLLFPWSSVVWVLYLLGSIAVIAMATAIWKSSLPLAPRFAVLSFAAVLINPHIYIYDLLMLAPGLLVLANWTLENRLLPRTPLVQWLIYLAVIVPLFGPIARWTHIQPSVIVFFAIVCTFYRLIRTPALASGESAVI